MRQKNFLYFLWILSPLWILGSCIKKEALTAESDIDSATIQNESEILKVHPVIGEGTVQFTLKNVPASMKFSPEFTLSQGATIDPASGTERDFTQPQVYTVTSQDGLWSKTYVVSFSVDNDGINYFNFENVEMQKGGKAVKYQQFYDLNKDGVKIYDWDSGNQGFDIIASTMSPVTPEIYPTFQTPDGYVGKGAEMVTRSTGSFGESAGAPLAAGNLFIGNFQLTFPAVKSTRFGYPYNYNTAPKALKGYFKYKRGADFIVNNGPSGLTKDAWNAYAILFEKQDGQPDYLLGDHDFKDPRMVSVAQLKLEDAVEASEWTPFEIPFEFVNGKTFDPQKDYLYTIVLSSSREGDKYNGAVGSTLWIDEVELVIE